MNKLHVGPVGRKLFILERIYLQRFMNLINNDSYHFAVLHTPKTKDVDYSDQPTMTIIDNSFNNLVQEFFPNRIEWVIFNDVSKDALLLHWGDPPISHSRILDFIAWYRQQWISPPFLLCDLPLPLPLFDHHIYEYRAGTQKKFFIRKNSYKSISVEKARVGQKRGGVVRIKEE